jgi:hypothetical protein
VLDVEHGLQRLGGVAASLWTAALASYGGGVSCEGEERVWCGFERLGVEGFIKGSSGAFGHG